MLTLTRHQLVLTDNFAVGRGKHTQNVERSATELNARSVSRQFVPIKVDPEWTKAEFEVQHRVGSMGSKEETQEAHKPY
jgi:hypothetical protein